ncbi:MAG TPA: beta-hydroxyacyl-ACP dehydratase [Syntrophales bacterium]|nr:beta-hydroxyacyl-ACP dehydratase [Syntrophales bacterium]
MAADQEMRDLILRSIPQQHPFRFIDEILELSENHIVGAYRFRKDEYFYRGHFPDRPITPGVLLIETMAQTGVVALGLYLTMLQGNKSLEETKEMITLFTMAEEVEFDGIVAPGERVVVRGEKIYFRRGSLKTKVKIERENGELVCFGTLAGTGVMLNET